MAVPGEGHQVDAAVFDVSFPTEERGSDLASHLTSVVRTRALPVMERVLDDLVPEDRTVVVEELELDLGELPWSEWPEALPRRLEEELRSALAGLGGWEPSRPSPRVRSVRPEESDREILRSYLRTGRLPWRRSTMDVAQVDALLERMVRSRPQELLELLRTVKPAAPALQRLVEQLPEAGISHLLGALPVADVGRLSEARLRIRALLDRRVPTQDGRQAMERAFLVALLGATVTRPSGSPARTVLAAAVQATPWGSEELARVAARTVTEEVRGREHRGGSPERRRGLGLAPGGGSDGAPALPPAGPTGGPSEDALVEEQTATSPADRRLDAAASAERLVGRRLRDVLRRGDPATLRALWPRWIREHPERVRRELREAAADPPVLARVARLFPEWWLEGAIKLLAGPRADPPGSPASTTLHGFVRWLAVGIPGRGGRASSVGGPSATRSGPPLASGPVTGPESPPGDPGGRGGRGAGRGEPPRAAALYEAALRYLAGSPTVSEMEPTGGGVSWPLQLLQADAGGAGRSVEEHLRHLEHLAEVGRRQAARPLAARPLAARPQAVGDPATGGDMEPIAAILGLLAQARRELQRAQSPQGSHRPPGAPESPPTSGLAEAAGGPATSEPRRNSGPRKAAEVRKSESGDRISRPSSPVDDGRAVDATPGEPGEDSSQPPTPADDTTSGPVEVHPTALDPSDDAESLGPTSRPSDTAADATLESLRTRSGASPSSAEGWESRHPTALLLHALRDGSPVDAEEAWARAEARGHTEAVAALARVLAIRAVRRRVAESARLALIQEWVTALAGEDLVPARLLASVEGLPDAWMGTGAASPRDLRRLVVREEALAALAAAPGAPEDASSDSPRRRNVALAARLLSVRARGSGMDPTTAFQAARASLESAASLPEPRATLLRHLDEAAPDTPALDTGDARDGRHRPRSVHEAVLEDAVLGGPVDTLMALWPRLRAEAPEAIREVFARHASSRWVLRSVVDRFPPALLHQLLSALESGPGRLRPPADPGPHPADGLPTARLRWADAWVRALQDAVAPAPPAAGLPRGDPDERESLVQMYESVDRVRRALVGSTGSATSAPGTLAALLPALMEEQPGQVLRLLRVVEKGENRPNEWSDDLVTEDLRHLLGHLVDAYLTLRLPGAVHLRAAVPVALARATDPRSFVARLLQALSSGTTVDLELLARPAPDEVADRATPSKAATSPSDGAGEHAIDPIAGDVRRGRPESLADAVVRAARGWDEPAPVRAELARMLETTSTPSEPLRRLVDDREVRSALARVLPEHLLARMILLLRPGAYAHARLVGDLIEEAVRDAGTDASPEWVSVIRWQATLEALLARGGVFRPKEFLSMLLREVADGLRQPSESILQALTGPPQADPGPARPALAGPAHLAALAWDPDGAAPSLPAPDAPGARPATTDPPSTRGPSGEAPDPDRTVRELRPREGTAEEAFEEDLDSDTDLLVSNAGIVLTAPFLPRLFSMVGLLEERAFRDRTAATRGVQLLHLLATGSTDAPEFLLPLPKLLCGFPLEAPVPRRFDATPEETEAVDQLLQGMIQHWDALGNTSPTGLRETFLQREGWLHRGDDRWDLSVEPHGVDILLDRVPWTFRTVALPWMPDVLYVDWR